MPDIIGDSPRVDIEHIIPFHRCFDNSYMNKTLCLAEENRNVKRNRTPFEAYGSNTQKWNEILGRVKNFVADNTTKNAKLRRFKTQDLDDFEDFSSRMLNDTRYASRLARDYLGLLYGEEAIKKVQVTQGAVTGYLRGLWDLNSILGDGGEKSREDHRHHAVDALVIALTDPGVIKKLSDAAKCAEDRQHRLFVRIAPPWDGFLDQAREKTLAALTSRQISRKVRGQLHDETFYGLRYSNNQKYHAIKKPLAELSAKESTGSLSIFNILDNKVREIVLAKWRELGKGDPDKIFSNKENLPVINKQGKLIPIKKVKVKKTISSTQIGEKFKRNVYLGTNHHIEIFKKTGKKEPTWEARLVSLFDAYKRQRKKASIINRSWHGRNFMFSLAPGEVIEIKLDGKNSEYMTVRTVYSRASGGISIDCSPLNDARLKKEIKKDKKWKEFSIAKLKAINCRKVVINPMGEVRRAND